MKLTVFCEIYFTHSARSKLRTDFVAAQMCTCGKGHRLTRRNSIRVIAARKNLSVIMRLRDNRPGVSDLREYEIAFGCRRVLPVDCLGESCGPRIWCVSWEQRRSSGRLGRHRKVPPARYSRYSVARSCCPDGFVDR